MTRKKIIIAVAVVLAAVLVLGTIAVILCRNITINNFKSIMASYYVSEKSERAYKIARAIEENTDILEIYRVGYNDELIKKLESTASSEQSLEELNNMRARQLEYYNTHNEYWIAVRISGDEYIENGYYIFYVVYDKNSQLYSVHASDIYYSKKQLGIQSSESMSFSRIV